jgi:lincosamide nucleotidyltransferase A/C/D/E
LGFGDSNLYAKDEGKIKFWIIDHGKKEKTSKEGLFAVLDVLEALGIKYWVEGGWGVDILTGRQNREHRDIDIDFDGRQEALL